MRSTTLPIRRTNDAGFSAIEMLVVVAIIGVITAIAVPNIRQGLVSYRLDAAVAMVTSKLSEARMNAIKRNKQARLRIDTTQRTVKVQIADTSGNFADLGATMTLPPGIDFAGTPPAEITFSSLGRSTATANLTWTLQAAQIQKRKNVTVSPVGKVVVGAMVNY